MTELKIIFRVCLLVLISLILGVAPVFAFTETPDEDDAVFTALEDEMSRTQKRLKLDKHEKPYFVQYKVIESDIYYLAASCGAISQDRRSRSRRLYTDLRVGDYKLDSSGGGSGLSGLFGSKSGTSGRQLPIEDDYYAIRQEVWLDTDDAYKKAIETYEEKKSHLKSNPEQDRLGDWTREKPVVFIKPSVKLEVDEKKWKDATRKLSALFLKYPEVENSVVVFSAQAGNAWLINNEGFKHRDGKLQTVLSASAKVRAADGKTYTDVEFFTSLNSQDMPSMEVMEKRVDGLVKRLIRVSQAPLAEEFSGPVLFSPEAAGPLLHATLAQTVAGANEKSGGESLFQQAHPFKNKIGSRVASRMLTVVDNPNATEFKGQKLFGSYEVDDDGVPAQEITLIEKGVLKTLCTSRIPTRGVDGSNGHSGNGVGTVSILMVSADPSVNAKKLKKKLIDLGKEQGYDYVYIARRIAQMPDWLMNMGAAITSVFSKIQGSLSLQPTELYRVSVANGKEELVRGASILVQPSRLLRDISAAGNEQKAVLVAQGQYNAMSIVVPAVIVRDVDIQEPSKKAEKPPILPSPLSSPEASPSP
ncbi:MAG: hypothetical protein IPM23_19770 [Candidatus Melainabacteria bacterium]|nr:hypothetical protein [Candidatus Melainabacteria bacterium]